MDAQGGSRTTAATPERVETVRSAFLRGADTYGDLGSPLYRALFTAGADDADLLELASHAQSGAQPAFHVIACVHYLLLGDPDDPLARYYATLTDHPAPPQEAFPHFARYCARRREEILRLLATRTVQTTYAERCGFLLPLISVVAAAAGEPLNLIEIGCSAGILLTFDKYAYEVTGQGRIGDAGAPVTMPCEMRGAPPLRIPRIGKRIGLDLHPIDVRLADERRWLTALSLPELRQQRDRLMTTLDVVAASDISLRQGDGLALVPAALADVAGPVCVYHSACLSYWPQAAREALDDHLKAASRQRDIYRVGIEASAGAYAWHQGSAGGPTPSRGAAVGASEFVMARYRAGEMESAVVACGPFFGPFDWIETPAWASGGV
jgi:hypothetical protein